MDRAFETVTDADLLSADLIMLSSMHAQRADARVILGRARALGRRTFIGGPWASSDPEGVLDCRPCPGWRNRRSFSRNRRSAENGTARLGLPYHR